MTLVAACYYKSFGLDGDLPACLIPARWRGTVWATFLAGAAVSSVGGRCGTDDSDDGNDVVVVLPEI